MEKYDHALTLKNGDDESPYMYFLRTKRQHYEQHPPKDSETRDSNAQPPKPGKRQGHATGGSETPLDDARPGTTRLKSHPPKGLRESLDQLGECPVVEDTRVAVTLDEYLRESAFAVGGFDEACACFFGDTLGKLPHP